MIRDLLAQQQRYLQSYFEAVDCSKIEEILELLFLCKGTLVLSGVGKSGHIAQKIAATFLSTGTKALFLDPTHAVHGDLGVLNQQDLFLAFSKSGESEELLELMPFVKRRGAKIIAIVSKEHSHLEKAADFVIYLPVVRELCPFDLAPTTSTTVQLLFGDCLATALMRRRNITLNEYALNHPGGLIGRRITLRVSDLMLRGEALPFGRPTDPLIKALPELSHKRSGCLLIVDDQMHLLGVFTDGDLRRSLEALGSKALEAPLQQLMTLNPRSIAGDSLAVEALRQMEADPARPIMVLPVLEEGRVVGLLRLHDILQSGL